MNSDDFHIKYRPHTFDDVVGQDEIVKVLERLSKERKVKAFLFSGLSGVGKTSLARITAKEYGCDQSNILEIDAATHTGIDSMREVTQSLLYRPIIGSSKKAIIVDEFHRLSLASVSSLLKSIEEPPPDTYWFFCTTDISKIPQTIKTRCSIFELSPIDKKKIFDRLIDVLREEYIQRWGHDTFSPSTDTILRLIASEANGSMRQALVDLQKCFLCETKEEAAALLKTASGSKEVIDLCRWLVKGRGLKWKRAMQFLKDLENTNPESIRLAIINYVSIVLMNTTDNYEVGRLLNILDSFSEPCNQSEKMAPILRGLGMFMIPRDLE